MLLLLPPSETKRDGGDGPPLELEDLSFSSLREARATVLDATVRRNAFGAQVHSFEDEVCMRGFETPITGVFIRAPIVVRLGEGVDPLADYEGKVVAVRQGNLLGTSFHPELTDDRRVHEWFLKW